jgi:branched-subunit amino acid aminotransferase/4-amino-4-deoxychorismate lyase
MAGRLTHIAGCLRRQKISKAKERRKKVCEEYIENVMTAEADAIYLCACEMAVCVCPVASLSCISCVAYVAVAE